jgi:beta-galactosidase
MKKSFLAIIALLSSLTGTARERVCFDSDWKFILGDSVQMASVDYNDAHWRTLNLPHDWAIEGDFYAGNPSGAGGGALPGGVAWYRKMFDIPHNPSSIKHHPSSIFLEFDGVYMNSTVYINGQKVGFRPYGYSSFEYDITPYIHEGENVVAVRVDNSDQPNSRWYSGCGIYRHVWLTKTHPIHIKHWGVYIHDGKVEVDYENPTNQKVTVKNTLLDATGKIIATAKNSQFLILNSQLSIVNSQLHNWSVDSPYIYKVRTQLIANGKVVDEVETTTGFRDFKFDAKTGFWLNGKNFKINGVCEHHDFGCLGAALNEDALHRKLVKLKAMGVNAIRCSHNPPAPELLNMCDTMGFIVMDESFDMWRRKKTQNDYARFFDEWHERDLTDLVLRDRNHPSILMWSIGNEVLEQWSETSPSPSEGEEVLTADDANIILNKPHDDLAPSTPPSEGLGEVSEEVLTQHLAEIVKRYDTTRPITAGCNEPSPNNHLFKSGAIDIIGYNYHHENVKDVPKNFPGKPFIFSESVSALQTRGYYMMPSDSIYKAPVQWWLPYTDPSFMCSAYDNMHASWSSTHEETWDVVKNNAFVGGQFIWTGFDYIGEPTPYGFPARSSYFGLIDLAGFPKDTYYMYQSEWTDKPMLHIFPHWNWLPGQEIDLWAYYNQADEAELFINGQSQGIRRKAEKASKFSLLNSNLCTPYHVMWRVAFTPGEIKVITRKDGHPVCTQTIRTAGAPDHIRLSVDYKGKDLTFITAEIVDKDGNLCPWADNQIHFKGNVVATDNGCQTSMERFTSPTRKAFHGKCLVVVRGNGTLTAQSIDLRQASLNF